MKTNRSSVGTPSQGWQNRALRWMAAKAGTLKLYTLIAMTVGAALAVDAQPGVSSTTVQAGSNTYQPPVFADTARATKVRAASQSVDKLYRQYAESHHFPGFAYGIVLDGKLLHTGSFGHLDNGQKKAVSAKSVFRIASMTKSFTALAILKLRDEGKLQLDDPAYRYIPALQSVQYLSADAPPITIRHLLTHAAGFPEDNPWGDRQLADTDQQLIQLIEQGPAFSTVPGTGYEYSNLGFALLGNIISRVSGIPYQQYITQNLLRPLGMVNTYWEYSQVSPNQLARGYRYLGEQWQEESLLHDGSYGAMGGLLTSIEDFSRYMSLHLSAWPPRNDADNGVVKRHSIREMHQLWRVNTLNAQYRSPGGTLCPTVTGYGYGLRYARDCQNRVSIGHSGGLPGFGSNWTILPEYGLGVVCFSNLTYAPTSAINQQVMDTLVTLAELQPRQLPVSPILKKRQQELVALMPAWKNAAASGIFAENFFLDNPLDGLQKEAAALFAKAGKILRVGELVPENQLRGGFLLEGEQSNLRVSFTLTPEKNPLIQEFHLTEIGKK